MVTEYTATARAHSNIAFIKYWGNRDSGIRLPANSSLSMNLAALHSTTSVTWSDALEEDRLLINDEPAVPAALLRVSAHLDTLRAELRSTLHADVSSHNNFPMGAGIASSASAFAALTLAATAALGMRLSERELSLLARRGSGSAARSIPTGFVEWHAGSADKDSYAESIASPDYWPLEDVIAVISRDHKHVGSTMGHATANTSILQRVRVETAADRLLSAIHAILARDFEALAPVVEEDSNLMHAVMMTSKPSLFYWLPKSLRVMLAVQEWRRQGLQVCYTLDAGPNVHCICGAQDAAVVAARLKELDPDIEVIRSAVGGGAQLLTANDRTD
ncbi:MAG: diphosphomevalonate decarboxylase [Chloroflexi bacterium]|nr:diphosphomevalonate decarboxylase [Chloroflexota bacterium]